MILETIQQKTLLEVEYINSLLSRVNSQYSRFSIAKRNGGRRTIYHPSKELKTVQRIINDHIISLVRIHTSSMAYKLGSNTKKNAEVHAVHKYILRMDFKSFFESITYQDVYKFCQDIMVKQFANWNELDSEVFSKFVCYKGKLVMGAVTSPALTNIMCYELDELLADLSNANGVSYSRYADDLYFSTDKVNVLKGLEKEVYSLVSSLTNPSALKINSGKTFHSSRKRRVVVTGLVITNLGEISIGRKKKREIRSMIFNWSSLSDELKAYLSGYLSYIKSVEPEFVNNLCLKYGAEVIRIAMTYNHNKNK